MKNLFILLLLLFFTWVDYGNSPNPQATEKNVEHRVHQLACQEPPTDATTGELIEPLKPIYRDSFSPREAVWIPVDINFFGAQTNHARLYVTHRTTGDLRDGTELADVSDGYEELIITPESKSLTYIKVWEIPVVREKGYDVIVDFPPLGVYNKGIDIIDGISDENGIAQRGFIVPVLWVCLESIFFNHDSSNHIADAIDVRKNFEEKIHVPEWKKGAKSYPATYIKNKSVNVRAIFSAAPKVTIAEIEAFKGFGSLGDLKLFPVSFKIDKKSGNLNLGEAYFQVRHPTPNEIKVFFQEWVWYLRYVFPRNYSEDSHIGNSRNKIFVILAAPQNPWGTSIHSQPWTDVLDLVCAWTHGETNPEGAAAEITHHIHHNIGGYYDGSSFYTQEENGMTTGAFYLTRFLKSIPYVDKVDCRDTAKALVTFANVIGCDLNFRKSSGFGSLLHEIKLIGRKTYEPIKFEYHCFGSVGDKVFDPCFQTDVFENSQKKHRFTQLETNILWDDYVKKVVKKGLASYPEVYSYSITGLRIKKVETDSQKLSHMLMEPLKVDSNDSNDIKGIPMKQVDGILKKRLQMAKMGYDFANWGTETSKIISGISISKEILPQLSSMEKLWKSDHYTIERYQKNIYVIIRKLWKLGNDQFDVKMVVCPTFDAAKEYLILSYADSAQNPLKIKQLGTALGLNIGNVCFVTVSRTVRPIAFSSIDFIRHNVLIMMTASGSINEKMGNMSRKLDHLLSEKTPVNEYSQLKEIPFITDFSCDKSQLELGECAALNLKIKNPKDCYTEYLWQLTGGGIEKDDDGKFLFYASDIGKNEITVLVLNAMGLWSSPKFLEIEVKNDKR